MKRYIFPIDEVMSNQFFEPIRNKNDVIILLINTIKYVTNSTTIEFYHEANDILVIYIDKMSRFFYCQDRKIFSIQFPFIITEMGDEGITIYHKDSDITLDSKITSFLLSVLDKSYKHSFESIDDFYFNFCEELESFEIDSSESNSYWEIVKYLWNFEVGYLRYDIDDIRQNGDLHPLNHLDVCYSSRCTFKLGLHNIISIDDIIDIVNTTTNCQYIE